MKLHSAIDVHRTEYQNNRQALLDAIAGIDAAARQISLGGNQHTRERHVARGKLLPRDRIAAMIDPGTAFLEIGLFAAWGHYEDEVPSAGIITGVAAVCGQDCMII